MVRHLGEGKRLQRGAVLGALKARVGGEHLSNILAINSCHES